MPQTPLAATLNYYLSVNGVDSALTCSMNTSATEDATCFGSTSVTVGAGDRVAL